MRSCRSGNIDDYFKLFPDHGQILVEADINDMRSMCEDWEHVHLCQHCFRPYIMWDKHESNRHSRFQIMLEIISFYIFMIIVWIPLLVLMIVPAFVVYAYTTCSGFTKPKAFTGDNELADINRLSKRHSENTEHVSSVINDTIKEKNKGGGFKYTPLRTDDDDAGVDGSSQ